ncbi:atherin-like [Panicum virgatum]|nr:atherin-like [Panicum virgatum]
MLPCPTRHAPLLPLIARGATVPGPAIRRHLPASTATLSPRPPTPIDTSQAPSHQPAAAAAQREMDGGRPEMRRTMTLSEQLSTPDPAIRDFLKIPKDADVGGSPGEDGNPAASGGGGWKPLRDRLRLRRAAGAWPPPKPRGPAAAAHARTSSGDLSNSTSANSRSNKYNHAGEAAAAFSRTFSRAPSLRATPTFSRVASTRVGPSSSSRSTSSSRRPGSSNFRDHEEERRDDGDGEHSEDDDDDEEEDDEEEGKEEAPAAQMSLMALLEQSDSQWDDDEDEDAGGGARKNGEGDDDDDDGEGREEEMVHVCCVCMVRHKGAAFIPCGHTFCRLCSRELWVSRGNCPLCNGFIQEILDIF